MQDSRGRTHRGSAKGPHQVPGRVWPFHSGAEETPQGGAPSPGGPTTAPPSYNGGALWLNGDLSLIVGYFEGVTLVAHSSPLLIGFAGFKFDGIRAYPAGRDRLGISSKALLYDFEKAYQLKPDSSKLDRITLLDGKVTKLQP